MNSTVMEGSLNAGEPNAASAGAPTGAKLIVPKRVFKFGSLDLVDPNPDLPPLQALRLYAPNYPVLNTSRLADPELQGDHLVYRVIKPRVEVKGALTAREAVQVLKHWSAGDPAPLPAESAATIPEKTSCHLTSDQVYRLLRVMRSPRALQLAPRIHPLLLPPP